MKLPMITHVAILYQGKVYSLPAPNRHHDVIRKIVDETGVESVGYNEQGFLDDTGRWLRRKPALFVALEAEQVRDPANVRGGQLYSEDVW